MTTHYQTLGVVPSATKDEIKASFRKLSRENHPDKEHGNLVLYQQITEANEVLSDVKKRAAYDRSIRLLMNPCHKCDGDGMVFEMVAWKTRTRVMCVCCDGAGYHPVSKKER